MNFTQSFKLAIKSLLLSKMRALLTLLVMAWVLLSEAVFQFRASLWARGTGGAEPSQLYTTVERLSWMVVTVLLALLYWMALTRIC